MATGLWRSSRESHALRTVRHVTPCLRSSSRIDMPPRWSRRIAAYGSTFDICGMTSTSHQEHPDAARAPRLLQFAVDDRQHLLQTGAVEI
ncbi:hypothetical protein SCANM63S_00669 [Streptomyces canarius]